MRDLRRVQVVASPAHLGIYVGGVLSGSVPRSVGAAVAHALLDAIGERDEAAAIVRDLADADPYVTVRPNGGIHAATHCGICLTTEGAHSLTCPYLRARAFVAREGREEAHDHE